MTQNRIRKQNKKNARQRGCIHMIKDMSVVGNKKNPTRKKVGVELEWYARETEERR
jgi:hypothetical protein